ncbi:hypothetical protein GQ599_09760, partial [Streptococcus thermophilus]|nr:hypothetical protein [Streptococcus thermophilus]
CAGGIYFNQGCNGGWVNQAFKYIKAHGSVTEASYPYEAIDDVCRFDSNDVVATLTGYVAIPEGDEAALLEASA